MKIVNTIRTLAGACAFALTAHVSAAPILLVDGNGILTGATGVDVSGTLYNVTFADGTCTSLFNGCVNSAFTFETRENAKAAGQALLDQVFIDGPAGKFDSVIDKIAGCTGYFACGTMIPTYRSAWPGDTMVEITWVRNFAMWDDVVEQRWYMPVDTDTAGLMYNELNYARFEIAPVEATVPEPSSFSLMGLAMAGLVFSRRRKV